MIEEFRRLHARTSAGVAWSHGYPDGGALPTGILVAAVEKIACGLSVPLAVDIEDGYSSDPRAVSGLVAAIVNAGAVGINIEDGRRRQIYRRGRFGR
jgi:2-methylisocitrate lyase-like PEP mutase family enzyme